MGVPMLGSIEMREAKNLTVPQYGSPNKWDSQTLIKQFIINYNKCQ